MDAIIGIFTFLCMLTVIVGIHEYGHYVAMRLYGVKVKAFAIGMGKYKLWKHVDKHGVEWSFRPILIGGFVEADAESMDGTHPLKRIVIAFAGPLANLLCLFVPAVVYMLITAGPLEAAYATLGFVNIVFMGLWETLKVFFGIFSSGMLPQGTAGPLGIIGVTSAAIGSDAPVPILMMLFLLLNFSLALFNLLPILPLDGGRIVMSFLELFWRGFKGSKEVWLKVERVYSIVGLLFVLAIFVRIMFKDISNAWGTPTGNVLLGLAVLLMIGLAVKRYRKRANAIH